MSINLFNKPQSPGKLHTWCDIRAPVEMITSPRNERQKTNITWQKTSALGWKKIQFRYLLTILTEEN